MEGLRDGCRNVIRMGHHEVVLGDGHSHATDISLLEGIRTEHVLAYLAGDGHQWNGVHVGVGNGGDQVRGTRSGGGDTHTNATGRLRKARCCMACTLLVTDQDVIELFGGVERLVQWQDCAARQTKDNVCAQLFEGADNSFCAVNALGSLAARVVRQGGWCGLRA